MALILNGTGTISNLQSDLVNHDTLTVDANGNLTIGTLTSGDIASGAITANGTIRSQVSGTTSVQATNSTTSGEARIQANVGDGNFASLIAYPGSLSYIQGGSTSGVMMGNYLNGPTYFQANNTTHGSISPDGFWKFTKHVQNVAIRSNPWTGNGWLTLTAAQHNIMQSWYTPASYHQNSLWNNIADNGRYTAPFTGHYLVGIWSYTSTTSGGTTGSYNYPGIYKNGSQQWGGWISSYGADQHDEATQWTMPIYMNQNDYLELGFYAVGSGVQIYTPYCGMWVMPISEY